MRMDLACCYAVIAVTARTPAKPGDVVICVDGPAMSLSDADRRAIQSWDANQEPWHLEPPDTTAEDRKERDWTYMEGEARDFVAKYGPSALLRCVAPALEKAR